MFAGLLPGWYPPNYDCGGHLTGILTFAAERGWHLRLLSSAGTTYNRDYLAEGPDGEQQPMLNVFHRDGQTIRHFWGSELFHAPEDPGAS